MDRPAGVSDRTRRVEFGRDLTGPQRARRAVTDLLGDGPLADDVRLVVSELVTNVLRHTDGGGVLRLRDSRPDGPVRIEVEDAAAVIPAVPVGDPAGPGGQGLRIVAGAAHRWGVRRTWRGKVVWAELR